VGQFLLIDGIVAVALLGLWYVSFSRYNRRKGRNALRWVEDACSGRGEIVESHWVGGNRLQAHMRFAANWVEGAKITVRLLPRHVPARWALSVWRKQKETLTFEADLDYAPSFHLEVFRHRWLTQNGPSDTTGAPNWTISRPGPVVLTTRTQWGQELNPLVNTLMSSRGHNLISVRFRPESPHLTAIVALDSLSDRQTSIAFLNVLKDLAMGASASKR
jgi:hypothetical protein